MRRVGETTVVGERIKLMKGFLCSLVLVDTVLQSVHTERLTRDPEQSGGVESPHSFCFSLFLTHTCVGDPSCVIHVWQLPNSYFVVTQELWLVWSDMCPQISVCDFSFFLQLESRAPPIYSLLHSSFSFIHLSFKTGSLGMLEMGMLAGGTDKLAQSLGKNIGFVMVSISTWSTRSLLQWSTASVTWLAAARLLRESVIYLR